MFCGSKQLGTNLIERAEPPQRLGFGFRARETGGDERIGARGEMEPDLVVGLGFDPAASEREAQRTADTRGQHRWYPVRLAEACSGWS